MLWFFLNAKSIDLSFMKLQLYIPVYALTLLLSAALLFSVQPMFSKMVLPLLGGTPQVWNTAMLFFQMTVLAGYAYAHGTSKFFNVRTQAVLHISLLGIFTVFLPIAIPQNWISPINQDPVFWQLSLMALTIGGPFFVISGSAPMIQRWFAQTKHPNAENPYFLYGASNLGSMSALLAYPFLIEPLANLTQQFYGWMVGYIALIFFTAASAFLVWGETQKPKHLKKQKEQITWARRGLWLLLSFIPSSLMLGVTTYITTDIASAPLLWIVPLALYVGTFIIVFSRKTIISRDHIMTAFSYLMIALIVLSIMLTARHIVFIPLHLLLFFTAALACHTELARLKPRAENLTEFYLFMSMGGAIGGVFNAIIAPQIFTLPLEYPLILGLACFMRYASEKQTRKKTSFYNIAIAAASLLFVALAFNLHYPVSKGLFSFLILISLVFIADKRWLFAFSIAGALLFYPPGYTKGRGFFTNTPHQERNFFGIVRVVDVAGSQRILLNGTTNHGSQSLDKKHKLEMLSYYSTSSPVGDYFKFMEEKNAPQKIGIVGLGVGTTACYQKENRHFDFFEIDPKIIRIAQNPEYFTFLSDCKSPYSIITGDGRLTIQEKPDHFYDLILLDAFSSDNIPTHLLTIEAIRIYLKKLKPGGALLFNISNSYLDIEPVLSVIGKTLNIPSYSRISSKGKVTDTDLEYYPTHYFSMSYNKKYNDFLIENNWSAGKFRKGVRLWTDQYSNIMSVIGTKTSAQRAKEMKDKIAKK